MSQMDIAGGMLANELSRGRIATITVESMKFIRPVQVGDFICCHGLLKRAGRTSIILQLEVWVSSPLRATPSQQFKVTEAAFIRQRHAQLKAGKAHKIEPYLETINQSLVTQLMPMSQQYCFEHLHRAVRRRASATSPIPFMDFGEQPSMRDQSIIACKPIS